MSGKKVVLNIVCFLGYEKPTLVTEYNVNGDV